MKQLEPLPKANEKKEEKPSPKARHDPAKDGADASKHSVLDLQRSIGNQAVLSLLRSGAIQAKLHVSQPGDADEVEADRVAAAVTASPPETAIHRKCSCKGGDSCPECASENNALSEGIHRKGVSSAAGDLAVRDDLLDSLGPGQPLAPDVREPMESRFGRGFENVRVHNDSQAADSARSLNARAYTAGEHLVFGAGEFAPETFKGTKLLAHELTHSIQQRISQGGTGRPESQGSLKGLTPRSIQRQAAGPLQIPPAGEGLVDMTIGSTQLHAVTRKQAIAELKTQWRRLNSRLEGDKEGHAYQKKVRDDQYIVGFFADVLGGVRMPPLNIWDKPRSLLDEAKTRLDAGELERGADKLVEADNSFSAAHARFAEYRDGTITGAERSLTGLKVTAAAGAVAATIATGGVAAEAGLGLLGTSAVVGVAGGGYGATQEFAGQTGEQIAGTRKSFDLSAILKRGAVDAVTNFVGALAGGALSKYATRLFGSYLSNIGDEALIELGESLGFKGPLPRDFFLTGGQRFIADFLGGVGSTPLTTAVSLVVSRLTGQEKLPSREEFTNLVIKEMVQGGALQLFLGAILHGRGAAGIRGSKRAGGGASLEQVRTPELATRPVTPEPEAHVPRPQLPAAEPPTASRATPEPAGAERGQVPQFEVPKATAAEEVTTGAHAVSPEPAPRTVEEYIKRFGPPKRTQGPPPKEGFTAQPREKTFLEQRTEAIGEEGAPEVEAMQPRPTPGGGPEPISATTGKFAHNELPGMIEHFAASGETAKADLLRKILAWPRGVEPNSPGSSRYTELTMPDGRKGVPDGIDWEHGVVHELKPNTETKYARRGPYQAQEYAAAMNRDAIGGRTDWRPASLEYDANALEGMLRDWGVLPKLGGPSMRIDLLK